MKTALISCVAVVVLLSLTIPQPAKACACNCSVLQKCFDACSKHYLDPLQRAGCDLGCMIGCAAHADS